MVRIKNIRLYQSDNVPDHVFEEVCVLVNKLAHAFSEIAKDHDPNIILSALNRFHAATIITLITEEGLAEAARTEVVGLLKNIEHMSGQNIIDKKS